MQMCSSRLAGLGLISMTPLQWVSNKDMTITNEHVGFWGLTIGVLTLVAMNEWIILLGFCAGAYFGASILIKAN